MADVTWLMPYMPCSHITPIPCHRNAHSVSIYLCILVCITRLLGRIQHFLFSTTSYSTIRYRNHAHITFCHALSHSRRYSSGDTKCTAHFGSPKRHWCYSRIYFFWITGLLFTAATKKQGIGEGDLDLLAFIGSFTGIMGCWITVLIGSLTASLAGLIYIVATHKTRLYSLKTLKVPFGPFLVIGALVYVFFQPQIIHIFHSVMLVDTV